MDDARSPVLPPNQDDDSAERWLASLGSERTREHQRRQLQRVATLVCRVPFFRQPRRIGQRALPVRLGAVPWRSLQPAHAALAREAALASCPTLRAATSLLVPLRGVLRVALVDDPARLFLCLSELRVEGVSAELRERQFWFEREDEDEAEGGIEVH